MKDRDILEIINCELITLQPGFSVSFTFSSNVIY